MPTTMVTDGALGRWSDALVGAALGMPPGETDAIAKAFPHIRARDARAALRELPERIVVIGSGVTGAELAQAYLGLGSQVVLVSSRERVLPGEDTDAATTAPETLPRATPVSATEDCTVDGTSDMNSRPWYRSSDMNATVGRARRPITG